jgi:hypothetical protein
LYRESYQHITRTRLRPICLTHTIKRLIDLSLSSVQLTPVLVQLPERCRLQVLSGIQKPVSVANDIHKFMMHQKSRDRAYYWLLTVQAATSTVLTFV